MDQRTKRLLLNFLIELFLYALLLIIYFVVVLRFLGKPMNQLFHLNLWVYAFATLLLIIMQSVFLEWITSFLVNRLGIEKLE